MRIISGQYKGKHIRPPKGFKARPTTDFAKESLFNILMNQVDLDDLDVLDLFAGTGSISYEFMSRGARSVTAVEKDPIHFRFIRKTKDELGMELLHLVRGDAFRFIRKPLQSFDLIFADPPYDHVQLDSLPDLIFEGPLLSHDGLFILEHPASSSFNAHPRFAEFRKYGGVNFSFFS